MFKGASRGSRPRVCLMFSFSARRQDDRDGTASPFPGAPGVSPGLLLLLLPLGLSCRFQGLTLARSRQEARGNESLT